MEAVYQVVVDKQLSLEPMSIGELLVTVGRSFADLAERGHSRRISLGNHLDFVCGETIVRHPGDNVLR